MSVKSAAGIVFALVVSACPLASGTASAAERTDRPAKEAAGAANKCNPALNGDWMCRNAQTGKHNHLALSLKIDGGGAELLVVGDDGACRGCHTSPYSFLADGRRHRNESGIEYAASCNHRTKTRGHKIFRIALQLDSGKAVIEEYWIMSDGRIVIARFRGTMDGWDVKNSDREAQPYSYDICAKLE